VSVVGSHFGRLMLMCKDLIFCF